MTFSRHYPALAGEVDARRFASKLVAVGDGYNVQFGTMASVNGLFWDMPAFLHGYGSRVGEDLGSLLNSSWSLAGGAHSYSVTFTSDDRVRILAVGGFTFKINASPDNAILGFDAAGTAGFSNVHIAPNPWQRGVIQMTTGFNFQHQNGINRLFLDGDIGQKVQSLTTWMRKRGVTSDADDQFATSCVENAANSGMVAANLPAKSRFIVEPDGRVTWCFPETGQKTTAAERFTTQDAQSFWSMLGGDLTEVRAVAGNYGSLTTARPAPSFLALPLGYVEMRRTTRLRDNFAMMADGSIVSAGLPPVQGWSMKLRVVGPTFGYDENQEEHLRRFWAHTRRGLTFYPQWGSGIDASTGAIEMRRHLDPSSVLDVYGSNSPFAQRLHTTEAGDASGFYGKRSGGRLLLRRVDAGGTITESYPSKLDAFQDIEMKLTDDPSR